MSPTLLHAVVRVADTRTPDADLLDRFVHAKDEPAFEELVRRHGPLVWSVCRQLLPHHADAEDAFQAVFLALVRGAGSIRAGQALPAWLHGVAIRVATRVKRAAVRRRQREQRVAVHEADRPVPDAAWATLMSAVHEEVRQLPLPERTAFILCELEGVRQPDAAARLGWPLGTLSGRLCKARQKLLEQLTRRGIAPAVLALGGLAGSAGTVPAALVTQVSCFPTAGAAGVSSTVAALAGGLVEGVTMRVKLAAAALLVAGTLGFSGGAMVLSRADAQGGKAKAEQPPAATIGPAQPAQDGGRAGGARPGQNRVVVAEGEGGQVIFGQQGQPGGVALIGQGPGFGGMMFGGPPRWEYKFVDLKSDDRAAFEKEILTAGNDGWEYAGSERLRRGNDANQLVLVFKRPQGGGISGFGGFGGPGFGGPGLGGIGGGVLGVESRVLTLKNAKANDVVATVERMFNKTKGLKVVGEPISNTLVIIAEPATMKEILKVVESMDDKGDKERPKTPAAPGTAPRPPVPPVPGGMPGSSATLPSAVIPPSGGTRPGGALHVFTLKNAIADEMVSVLQRLFPNVEIAADARSNQLIIRADDRVKAELEMLIQKLDVQVKK